MSRSVDQASGIVAVHADCSIEAAVKLMEARAAATGRSLEQIAEVVLDGGKRKYLVRRTPDARLGPRRRGTVAGALTPMGATNERPV